MEQHGWGGARQSHLKNKTNRATGGDTPGHSPESCSRGSCNNKSKCGGKGEVKWKGKGGKGGSYKLYVNWPRRGENKSWGEGGTQPKRGVHQCTRHAGRTEIDNDREGKKTGKNQRVSTQGVATRPCPVTIQERKKGGWRGQKKEREGSNGERSTNYSCRFTHIYADHGTVNKKIEGLALSRKSQKKKMVKKVYSEKYAKGAKNPLPCGANTIKGNRKSK